MARGRKISTKRVAGLVVSHEGRSRKLPPHKPLLGERLTECMLESCSFENGIGPESFLEERFK